MTRSSSRLLSRFTPTRPARSLHHRPSYPLPLLTQFASRSVSKTVGLLASLALGSSLALIPSSAKAAERVPLTYGFVEISSSVEELRTFAETGVPGPELAPYFRFLSDEQQLQIRSALQARKDISPVEMSQFLYSSIGGNILQALGSIIRTQGRRDGSIGLRGALVLAAAEPEGLSLLGVIEQFPTNTIRIDAQRGFRLFNTLTSLIEDTQNALTAIRDQSQPPSRLSGQLPPLQTLSEPGQFSVSEQTLSVVDEARSRTLTTDLYLPDDAPPAGVVIISHGLAGDRKGFVGLARHLASHGYAVAALDHPGSNRTRLYDLLSFTAQEVADPSEFSDRPLDISHLLDELTELNQSSETLANRFDLDRVVLIGHSFGGYTVLAASGAQLNYSELSENCASTAFVYNGANPSMLLQCTALLDPVQFESSWQEPRVDAVIALNPVTSSLFGQSGFTQISVPSLMIAGSEDPLAPALLEQIQPFTWLTEAPPDTPASQNNHFLALIERGSHLYDPIEVSGPEARLANTLVSADSALAQRYLNALSLSFIQAEVEQNPIYKGALNDATAVRIGEQPLPLYVVDTLTSDMLRPTPPEETAPSEESPEEPLEAPESATPDNEPMPAAPDLMESPLQ